MTTPYRQPIHANDVGLDVLAVKRAMKKMHAQESKKIRLNRRAGAAFVHTLRAIEHNHGQRPSGIYGQYDHAIIAPHFDAYGRLLYQRAKIRKPKPPPPPGGTAQAEARQLLAFHAQGKYRADNYGDLYDLQKTAAGEPVWSQCGYYVHLDPRPLRLLVWLIESGYKIGTFALCSDHHCDGPHGHSGGRAVDISSINDLSIASGSARSLTLAVAEKINHAPGLRPRQQICGGYGYQRSAAISACSIPAADSYYGRATMLQHCNHIHVGY